MNCNALKISYMIETMEIDFSSLDSIKQSTGFRRLYTIHTANTIAMSQELGFHVGGFCDDYGHENYHLAAKVAGYEELPSSLILCAMDDRYNFLPLTKEQAEAITKCIIAFMEKEREPWK